MHIWWLKPFRTPGSIPPWPGCGVIWVPTFLFPLVVPEENNLKFDQYNDEGELTQVYLSGYNIIKCC